MESEEESDENAFLDDPKSVFIKEESKDSEGI